MGSGEHVVLNLQVVQQEGSRTVEVCLDAAHAGGAQDDRLRSGGCEMAIDR